MIQSSIQKYKNDKSIVKRLSIFTIILIVSLNVIGASIVQVIASSGINKVKKGQIQGFNGIMVEATNGLIKEYEGITETLAQNSMIRSFLADTGHKVKKGQIQGFNGIMVEATNGLIKEYEGITETLAQNSMIRSFLADTGLDSPMGTHEDYSLVLKQIQEIKSLRPDIISLISIGNIEEDILMNDRGSIHTNDKFSLKTRPYFSAVTEQTTIITEPYTFASDGQLGITIATPVYHPNDNSVTGIVVVDITISSLKEFISKYVFGETGISMIVDQNGQIVAHENEENVGKHVTEIGFTEKIFTEEIANPSSDMFKYRLNNTEYVAIATTLGRVDWKVLTTMSDSEFNYEAYQIMGATVIVQIVIVIMLIVFLVKRIRESLRKVLTTMSDSEFNYEAYQIMGATVIVQIVIVIMLIVFLVKRIRESLRPLSEIGIAMQGLSEGKLDQTLNYTEDDEIGQLAEITRVTIKKLSSYIHEIALVLGAVSKGDFTQRVSIQFEGNFVQIQNDLETVQEVLTRTLNQINASSEEVLRFSEQVSNGAQELAEGSIDQSSSLQALASKISEISQNAINSSKNSVETSQKMMKLVN